MNHGWWIKSRPAPLFHCTFNRPFLQQLLTPLPTFLSLLIWFSFPLRVVFFPFQFPKARKVSDVQKTPPFNFPGPPPPPPPPPARPRPPARPWFVWSNEWARTFSTLVFHLSPPPHPHTHEIFFFLFFLRPIQSNLFKYSFVPFLQKPNSNGSSRQTKVKHW